MVPGGLAIAGQAIADAYLQVSVFVAATIMVVYAAGSLFRTDLGEVLARHRAWQVPAGALLGALPGCGGAIVAVTQFTRGTMSFGALVATLTSTMGDAVFLLLARDPATAGLVLAVRAGAGIVTDYALDAFSGPQFMPREKHTPEHEPRAPWFDGGTTGGEVLWFSLLVPGLVLSIVSAFQLDIDSMIASTTAFGPARQRNQQRWRCFVPGDRQGAEGGRPG